MAWTETAASGLYAKARTSSGPARRPGLHIEDQDYSSMAATCTAEPLFSRAARRVRRMFFGQLPMEETPACVQKIDGV